MNVQMYKCITLWMYECIKYECIKLWMWKRKNVLMHKCSEVWMNKCNYDQMIEWINECMCECKNV